MYDGYGMEGGVRMKDEMTEGKRGLTRVAEGEEKDSAEGGMEI